MATRVNIKKALEERLRKATGNELAAEIVKLLDEESAKRGAGSTKAKDGLGYKELVSLFRFHLGPDLVLPPDPNTTWIIRMVNTARQMGVKQDNVEQIVRGLRKQYPRGPYQLGFIIQRADVHFAAGEDDGDQPAGQAKEGKVSTVYTGRDTLECE